MPRRRRKDYKYREIFFAYNGPGPYACFSCGDPVSFVDVNVHHLDEDEENDSPENLVASHRACHVRFHQQGERNSAKRPEARRKISEWQRGRRLPDSTRVAMSAGQRSAWRRRRERGES